MVQQYGVGYFDSITEVDTEILLPDGFVSDVGLLDGTLNGAKGKLDYDGDYWFFARQDPTGNNVPYLFRAHRDPGTGVITLSYVSLATLGDGDVCPNQLTVDYLGNVYFPSGNTGGSAPVIYKGTVTSENPFTMSFTPSEALSVTYDYAVCVTLSADHSKIATITIGDNSTPGISASVRFVQTSDMTLIASTNLGKLYPELFWQPYNAETDVYDDSDNFDWGYVILPKQTEITLDYAAIVAFSFETYAVVWNAAEDDNEVLRILCVNHEGSVYAATRTTNVGHEYEPDGITPGTLAYVGAKDLTNPIAQPTHNDVIRTVGASHDFYFASAGISPDATGEVRKEDAVGVESTPHTRASHLVISVACTREVRVEPPVPEPENLAWFGFNYDLPT